LLWVIQQSYDSDPFGGDEPPNERRHDHIAASLVLALNSVGIGSAIYPGRTSPGPSLPPLFGLSHPSAARVWRPLRPCRCGGRRRV